MITSLQRFLHCRGLLNYTNPFPLHYLRKFCFCLLIHTVYQCGRNLKIYSSYSLITIDVKYTTLATTNTIHSTTPCIFSAWGTSSYARFSFVKKSFTLTFQCFWGTHEAAERSAADIWSEALSTMARSTGNTLQII